MQGIPRHAVSPATAVALAALGLADGGYSLNVIAATTFCAWWAIALGVGLRVLPRERLPRAAILSGAALGGLLAWTALSIVWATDAGAAFAEVVRICFYLGAFLLVLLLSSRRQGARPWLSGLAAAMTAIVVAGLATRFFPALGSETEPLARLSDPIGYWNGLGACAALATTLLLWHSAGAESQRIRALATALLPLPMLAIHLSSSRGGLVAAAIGCLALVCLGPRRIRLLAGLALGGGGALALVLLAGSLGDLSDGLDTPAATREGRWLLLATVAVTALVGWWRWLLDRPLRQARVSRRVSRGALAAAAAVCVIGVVAADPPQRFEEFKESPYRAAAEGGLRIDGLDRGLNSSGRYQFWDAALEAFAAEPLHGVGAGQYETWWNQHGSIYWALRDAHSLVLESMAELGAVGILLLLASLLALPVASAWRRRRTSSESEIAAALALLLAGLFAASNDWLWELPAVFLPVVVAAALLTGSATRPGPPAPTPGAPLSARRRAAVVVATIAVSGAVLWSSADLLLTRARLADSRAAVRAGEAAAAVDSARDAVALQPWAAEPRLQLALALQMQGNTTLARAELAAAAQRAPEEWRIPFALGRLERQQGHRAAAQVAMARALALLPRSPLVRGAARQGRR